MEDKTVEYPLGRLVAKHRKAARVSAEDLARRAGNGLTRSIIANLENGRKGDVTVKQLIAIAYVLGVSPVDLVFDLHDPYADTVVVEGEEAVLVPTWLAHGWFGATRNLYEAQPHRPDGTPLNPPRGPIDNWSIAYYLKQRDAALIALEAHEEQAKWLAKNRHPSGNTDDESPPSPWLTTDVHELSTRVRDFRAELYEIDRHLRALGVNIDRPAVKAGVPF